MAAWRPNHGTTWQRPPEHVMRAISAKTPSKESLMKFLNCENSDWVRLTTQVHRLLDQHESQASGQSGSEVPQIAHDLGQMGECRDMLNYCRSSTSNPMVTLQEHEKAVEAVVRVVQHDRRVHATWLGDRETAQTSTASSTAETQHQVLTKARERDRAGLETWAATTAAEVGYLISLYIVGGEGAVSIGIAKDHPQLQWDSLEQDVRKRWPGKKYRIELRSGAGENEHQPSTEIGNAISLNIYLLRHGLSKNGLELLITFLGDERSRSAGQAIEARSAPYQRQAGRACQRPTTLAEDSTLTASKENTTTARHGRPVLDEDEADEDVPCRMTGSQRHKRQKRSDERKAHGSLRSAAATNEPTQPLRRARGHDPRDRGGTVAPVDRCSVQVRRGMAGAAPNRQVGKNPTASAASWSLLSSANPAVKQPAANRETIEDELTADDVDDLSVVEHEPNVDDDDNESAQPVLVADEHKLRHDPLPDWVTANTYSTVGKIHVPGCHDDDLSMKGRSGDLGEDGRQDREYRPDAAVGQAYEGKDEDDHAQEMLQSWEEGSWAQMDHGLLKEMAALFRISEEVAWDPNNSHLLDGMLRPLRMHQLYGAYVILKGQKRGLNGQKPTGVMFLADEMGLGKSAQCATIIYVNRVIDVLTAEITKARSSGRDAEGRQHLPLEGQGEGATCPSQDQLPIQCPCVKDGVSAHLDRTGGINVFISPRVLLANAAKELFMQLQIENSRWGFKVYVQAPKGQGKNAVKVRLTMGTVESRREVVTDLATLYMREDDRDNYVRQAKKTLAGLTEVIVLTTEHALPGHMDKYGIFDIPVGQLMRDEYHQQPGLNNRLHKIIRDTQVATAMHKTEDSDTPSTMKITLVTGTPIRLGPQDLMGAMSLATLNAILIQNGGLPRRGGGLWEKKDGRWVVVGGWFKDGRGWEQMSRLVKDEFWRQFTPFAISEFSSLKDEERSGSFKRLLDACLIGRKKGGRWFNGELLLPLPRMHHRICAVEMDPDTAARTRKNLHDWQQRVMEDAKVADKPLSEKDKGIYSRRLAHAGQRCALMPELSWLMLEGVKKRIEFEPSAEWMNKQNLWTTKLDDDRNPYRREIRRLTKNNPRFRALRDMLEDQLPLQDFRDRRRKGLIFTKSIQGAMVVYQYLKCVLTSVDSGKIRIKPAVIWGTMPQASRDEVAATFQHGTRHDDYNILIGVASALGTGLTLTEASFVILAEQHSDPALERQLVSRAHRYTNWNWCGINVWEILTEGWEYDTLVRQQKLGRNNFALSLEDLIFRQTLRGSGCVGDMQNAAGGEPGKGKGKGGGNGADEEAAIVLSDWA